MIFKKPALVSILDSVIASDIIVMHTAFAERREKKRKNHDVSLLVEDNECIYYV